MKTFLTIIPILLLVVLEVAIGELFAFKEMSTPYEFIFELTNPERIEEARDIITTKRRSILKGVIIKEKAPYNPRWSFHYNSTTIKFVYAWIEVCDAAIVYLEEHYMEAGGSFMPNNVWCPWGAELTREVNVNELNEVEDRTLFGHCKKH